jgi:hypothetical protein
MADKTIRGLFWMFAAVGAYYLITEHRAHLLDYLPYILLMACPLMHLFHRHGGHHHDEDSKEAK